MRPLALLAVLLAALVAAAPARAQADAREEARQHYERGIALSNAADYAGALAAFREAYTKIPHFFVLYNVGQAEAMLGHPVEAIAALRRYLTDGADQVPADRKQEVEKQITELEGRLAELTVTTDRAGLLVLVDDKEIGRTPLYAPLRLAPGRHVVTLREGDRSQVTAVELAEAERRTLSLTVPVPVPIPETPKAPPALPTPPLPAPTRDGDEGSSTQAMLGVVSAGAGVAVGTGALVHYLWNRGRYDDWKDEHAALEADRRRADYRERQLLNNARADSITKASRVTVTLSLVAGVLAAGGAILFSTSRNDVAEGRVPEHGVSLAWGARGGTAIAWTAW